MLPANFTFSPKIEHQNKDKEGDKAQLLEPVIQTKLPSLSFQRELYEAISKCRQFSFLIT